MPEDGKHRTLVRLADGTEVTARERWSTVVRHIDTAAEKNRVMIRLTVSDEARVAVNPAAIASITELAR